MNHLRYQPKKHGGKQQTEALRQGDILRILKRDPLHNYLDRSSSPKRCYLHAGNETMRVSRGEVQRLESAHHIVQRGDGLWIISRQGIDVLTVADQRVKDAHHE